MHKCKVNIKYIKVSKKYINLVVKTFIMINTTYLV